VRLLVGVVGAALAAGRELPDAAAGWAARLDRTYEHYKAVEPQFLPDGRGGLPCADPRHGVPSGLQRPGMETQRAAWEADPKGVWKQCQALDFNTWMLRMDLTPHDQRVFPPAWVRVIELPKGRSAAADLQAWLDTGVLASKAVQAMIPVDRYLLDLHLPCAAGMMLDYEVADLVASLQETPALPMPPLVAVSRCGQLHFEARTPAEVRERGRRETEFWGLRFPEVRDAARAAVRDGEMDLPPAP
jgi:hypothetical protein